MKSMNRAFAFFLCAEAHCHQCPDWEPEREENDTIKTTILARNHVRANPTHVVYVEQVRMVVHKGAEYVQVPR